MERQLTAAAMCTACLLVCCGAALGRPDVYFTEYQFNVPKIKAMAPDGSNVRELFTIPSPTTNWLPNGLAVSPDGQTVFWTNSVSGQIRLLKSGVAGTNPAPVSIASAFTNSGSAGTAQSIRGGSLDAQGRVYFQTANAATTTPVVPFESSIRRVNADGTGLTTIRVTGDTGATGGPFVDATNGHVYFQAKQQIVRTDLDGNNLKVIVRGSTTPLSIAVDRAAGYIYWADANTNSDFIGRANLDGTGFTILRDLTPGVVQSSAVVGIVLDKPNNRMFISTDGTNNDKVYSMNLDGSNLQAIYTSPSGLSPTGISLSTGALVQPLADCNGNAVADDIDIANGTSTDCNGNGVPDSCEIDPCPTATVLFDAGSDAVSTTSRALGTASAWVAFQPFVVPAGGWNVGQIALDGFTTNYVDGSGVKVEIFRDNDASPDATTFTTPNEGAGALAGVPNFNFRFDTLNETWVYAPLSVSLSQGLYWVRIAPNLLTTYNGSVNLAAVGSTAPVSRFRGTSGVLQTSTRAIAVRLIEGVPIFACCAPIGCSVTTAAACVIASGTVQVGAVCDPNPCAPPTGACCAGATCIVVTAASCQGAGVRFAGPGLACNASGNTAVPCCLADFDQGGVVNIDDIFIYLRAWFAGDLRADVNNNGLNIDDIFVYINIWFAGC